MNMVPYSMYCVSKDHCVDEPNPRATTSQTIAPTSGRFSHAIQTPVVSVNLSIRRTALIRPEVSSAMRSAPAGCKEKGGGSPPPRLAAPLLLRGPGLLLREVIVGRERIRREHEALRRHHLRGVLALRVEHLLEE